MEVYSKESYCKEKPELYFNKRKSIQQYCGKKGTADYNLWQIVINKTIFSFGKGFFNGSKLFYGINFSEIAGSFWLKPKTPGHITQGL